MELDQLFRNMLGKASISAIESIAFHQYSYSNVIVYISCSDIVLMNETRWFTRSVKCWLKPKLTFINTNIIQLWIFQAFGQVNAKIMIVCIVSSPSWLMENGRLAMETMSRFDLGMRNLSTASNGLRRRAPVGRTFLISTSLSTTDEEEQPIQ